MLVEFKLDMPNRGSWNGRWTGEDSYYGVVLNIPKAKALKIVEGKSYGYDFGDGWFATVGVRQVDFKEAQGIRKKSKGFGSYVWMVDSILSKGVIERPSR